MALLKSKFTESFKKIIAFTGGKKIPQGLSSNSTGETTVEIKIRLLSFCAISEGHRKPGSLGILHF